MYKPLPNNLTIGPSAIEGLGLFATCSIPRNIDLGMTHVFDERFPDQYIRLPLGGFFNHSNEPNCKIVEAYLTESGEVINHLRLITIKDINEGEELTVTYTLYDPTK